MKTESLVAAIVALLPAAPPSAGETLTVRVLDARGQPVPGIPLEIQSALIGAELPTARVTTDAGGNARFEGAERWYTPAAHAQVPLVRARLMLDAEVSFPLLQAHVPIEPIELRLPPCGELRIRLRNPNDLSLGGYRLGIEFERWREVERNWDADPLAPAAREIRVKHMAVAGRFDLTLYDPKGSVVCKRFDESGPAVDEIRTIDIALNAKWPPKDRDVPVHGVLVDENDTPLAARDVLLRWHRPRRDPSRSLTWGSWLTSGSLGDIDALMLGSRSGNPLGRIPDTLSIVDPEARLLGELLIPLRVTPMSDALDFGTVRMRPVPELVRGRVVDEEDKCVEGARVVALRLVDGADEHDPPDVSLLGAAADCFSRVDGGFALLGEHPADERFVVMAWQKGFWETRVLSTASPRAPIQLVLQRPFSLTGRVRGQRDANRRFHVAVRYTDEGGRWMGRPPQQLEDRVFAAESGFEGWFVLRTLRSGNAEVSLSRTKDGPPILVQQVALARDRQPLVFDVSGIAD